METRIATSLASGRATEAAEKIARDIHRKLDGSDPALIVAFASTTQPLSELMPALASEFPGAVLLGASTAGEFTENGDAKNSVAVFGLAGDYRVVAGMGTGLKANVEAAVQQAVSDLPPSIEGYPHRTALVLLDPFAGRSEEAVLIAAGLLGGDVRMAGGAAGDDLKMKSTFVACGTRVASDAIVVALLFSKRALGVGVCHGHTPVSRPLRVTKASGSVVYEIEGRPAWTVWAEMTRGRAVERQIDPFQLRSDEVPGYLLQYEAGLPTGSEYKIRAPLARQEDGSLTFACGIPEGAFIRITESVPTRQVESAREAAKRARAQTGDRPIAGALVFDCICRNLILDKEFGNAVKGISEELGRVPIAGFETYGEIAMDAGDMSGFHNTTTVVLAFPK
jgi:methyl-accepting chemotaxis protein